MSVWSEVRDFMRGKTGDAYAPILRLHLAELPDGDAELFRMESEFALGVRDESGDAFSYNECEQKIMERFAEEESARS